MWVQPSMITSLTMLGTTTLAGLVLAVLGTGHYAMLLVLVEVAWVGLIAAASSLACAGSDVGCLLYAVSFFFLSAAEFGLGVALVARRAAGLG
jgi:hypothetical protein